MTLEQAYESLSRKLETRDLARCDGCGAVSTDVYDACPACGEPDHEEDETVVDLDEYRWRARVDPFVRPLGLGVVELNLGETGDGSSL